MVYTVLVNILRLLFVESKLEITFYFLLQYTIENTSKLALEDAGPCKHRALFGTSLF